jgi:hypothetical protein
LCIGFIVALLVHAHSIRRARERTVCIANLRLIESAKEQWALEYNKTNSDTPRWEDLIFYRRATNLPLPYYPSGGKYTLGAMSNKPTCSYPGHVLP